MLNAIWESLHAFLYDNYMGGEITKFILVRASLFDAILITAILLLVINLPLLKNKTWVIIIVGLVVAVANEWYGLGTSRWAYNELMPIMPIIKTGLTPTLQLGILGYITYKIQDYMDLIINPSRG